VLPQVLAGLGLFSLLSVGCLFWLERLQPLFFGVAIVSLVYQAWIVVRRPSTKRTWGIKTIFGLSLSLNLLLIAGWVIVWFRYQ